MLVWDKKILVDESGNVLFLLLLAVGLFAALSYAITGDSSNNESVTAQKSFQMEKEMLAQISQIQSAVQQCVLLYPAGQTGQPNIPYPLAPDDTVVPADANTDLDVATDISLDQMMCPGNVGRVFDGAEGRFAPLTIRGFGDWTYTNDSNSTGVFMQITANGTQPHVITALNRIVEQTSSCEVALNADADGGGACGATCLTFWLKNPNSGC